MDTVFVLESSLRNSASCFHSTTEGKGCAYEKKRRDIPSRIAKPGALRTGWKTPSDREKNI